MQRLAPLHESGLSLFVGALALYVATLSPSLNWGDGGRIQLDITLGGSNYLFLPELSGAALDSWPFARLGVAPWDHPLYVVLGQATLALPIGDPLWRLNLLSAVAAAAVIGLVFRVLVGLGVQHAAAALGALALAVSHTFWLHAVTTEVLALHALFMVSLVGVALRWSVSHRAADLRWFALLAGLGLANHLMLGLTLLPTVAYLILSAPAAAPGLAPRAPLLSRAAIPTALFLVGLAPWWVQFLRVVRVTGLSLAVAGVTWLPSAPQETAFQASLDVARNLLSYAGYLTYQFTPLGVVLGIVGFMKLARTKPPVAALLAALYAVHVAFSTGFSVTDRFAFHLPSYVIFALFIGIGAEAALELQPRRSLRIASLVFGVVVAPVVLYAATPRALRAWGITDADFAIPDVGFGARDGLAYFFNPDKRGDESAVRFGRSTLSQLAPGAVVLAPEPYLEVGMVLRYLQHAEKSRPDVHVDPLVIVPRGDLAIAEVTKAQALGSCRSVYLAALPAGTGQRKALLAHFHVIAEANLHRLVPRHPVPATPCPASYEPMSLRAAVRSALR